MNYEDGGVEHREIGNWCKIKESKIMLSQVYSVMRMYI